MFNRKSLAILLFIVLLSTSVLSIKLDKAVESNLKSKTEVSVIVKLKEGTMFTKDSKKSNLGIASSVYSNLDKDLKKKTEYSVFNGFSGNITAAGLEKLKNNYHPFLQESRPIINSSVAVQRLINSQNLTGKGFSVCVIDTGINYTHNDFGSCTAAQFTGGTCAKVLGGYDYVNSDNNPYDGQGHGTHVSGIIAANGNITGVAPDATIVSVKVCTDSVSSTCSTSDILSGLNFCVSNRTAFNITAISLSLGSSTLYSSYCDSDSSFTSIINTAVGYNMTVVASSGNDGSTSGISDPACIQNVTSVGATYDYEGTYSGSCSDSDTDVDEVACFSNINGITDLLAPGAKINSTYHTGGYIALSGTSMSAPMVSGAVTILQQYKLLESNTNLSFADVYESLRSGGKNISSSGFIIPRLDIVGSLIIIDSKKPGVIIVSIGNGSVYNLTSLDLNFSAVDTNLDSCFYSLNGAANTTSSCSNSTLTLQNTNNTLDFYVNDSKGNINITNLIFDIDRVSTILDSPINYLNSSNNNVTFYCSGQTLSGKNLFNITLYHNISNAFSANLTNNVTRSFNGTIFSLTNIPDGIYLWNCFTMGNSTAINSSFAMSNFSLTIDTTRPIFSSISSSPDSTSASITWSSNELTNSTVYYGTDISTSSSSVSLSKVTSHSISLSSLSSSTLYYYNVTGCDYSGNCNASSQFSFTTSAASSPSGGSSGGGGGGGGGGGSASTSSSDTKKEQSFTLLEPHKENIVRVSKSAVAVTLVSITANKQVPNVIVTIEDFASKKPVSTDFTSNVVYRYFSIGASTIQEKDFENVLIRFKVDKVWLKNNGLTKDKVVVYRWHDREYDYDYEYSSTSPGFSYFMIGDRINKTITKPVVVVPGNQSNILEKKYVLHQEGENLIKAKSKFNIYFLIGAILILGSFIYFVTSHIIKRHKR